MKTILWCKVLMWTQALTEINTISCYPIESLYIDCLVMVVDLHRGCWFQSHLQNYQNFLLKEETQTCEDSDYQWIVEFCASYRTSMWFESNSLTGQTLLRQQHSMQWQFQVLLHSCYWSQSYFVSSSRVSCSNFLSQVSHTRQIPKYTNNHLPRQQPSGVYHS